MLLNIILCAGFVFELVVVYLGLGRLMRLIDSGEEESTLAARRRMEEAKAVRAAAKAKKEKARRERWEDLLRRRESWRKGIAFSEGQTHDRRNGHVNVGSGKPVVINLRKGYRGY